jgi:hypothetical protein
MGCCKPSFPSAIEIENLLHYGKEIPPASQEKPSLQIYDGAIMISLPGLGTEDAIIKPRV